MHCQDFLCFRSCTSGQKFYFGVLLVSVDRTDNGRKGEAISTPNPDVNFLPISAACSFEVAVIEGVVEIRESRVRGPLWTVNHNFMGFKKSFELMPEMGVDHDMNNVDRSVEGLQ